MPNFWSDLSTDLRLKARWCYGADGGRQIIKVCLTDGTAAMVCYRLQQWARRWRLTPLELVLCRLNAICCNCIIGRGAEFGPGFVLIHATGVVINGRVTGGHTVLIEHQVTIGAERGQSPVLGNEIFIGAGAKVVGSVTVGDGARIGANAVVTRDVEPWTSVGGVPAKVIRRREEGSSLLAHGAITDIVERQQ